MMVLPPVAAAQAGHASGGGFLDSIKNAVGGGTGQAGATQVDAGPRGDGSVGLLDGVWKKALFGGAAGAALGFLPFIPGGPILGGVVGALGGAAMGVFSNWRKMNQIKQENQAMIAAMGVQADNPQIAQVLQTGQVGQLIPMMQAAQQGDPSQGVTQGVPTQGVPTQGVPTQGVGQAATQTPSDITGKQSAADLALQEQMKAQLQAEMNGQLPAAVDPSTAGIQQSPVPTQGTVAVGSGAGAAISPASGMNPGVAPAMSQGGGGAAGDAGRPPAPAGTNSNDVSAIAPLQAGIGGSSAASIAPRQAAIGPTAEQATGATTGAAEGAEAVTAATPEQAQIVALINQLQKQIDMLKAMIENDQRREAESLEAQGNEARRAA